MQCTLFSLTAKTGMLGWISTFHYAWHDRVLMRIVSDRATIRFFYWSFLILSLCSILHFAGKKTTTKFTLWPFILYHSNAGFKIKYPIKSGSSGTHSFPSEIQTNNPEHLVRGCLPLWGDRKLYSLSVSKQYYFLVNTTFSTMFPASGIWSAII